MNMKYGKELPSGNREYEFADVGLSANGIPDNAKPVRHTHCGTIVGYTTDDKQPSSSTFWFTDGKQPPAFGRFIIPCEECVVLIMSPAECQIADE